MQQCQAAAQRLVGTPRDRNEGAHLLLLRPRQIVRMNGNTFRTGELLLGGLAEDGRGHSVRRQLHELTHKVLRLAIDLPGLPVELDMAALCLLRLKRRRRLLSEKTISIS